MLKQYIEFFYPGSFMSESSSEQVSSREITVTLPKGAYGYRFFSRQEAELNGEILKGSPSNFSPMTYYGEALTLDQVKALPNSDILQSNMINNKWDRVARTIRGNFQPLNDGDAVVMK